MPENTNNIDEEIQELIRNKIENLRLKLLDLGRRNPLISTKFSPRSNSIFRAVDELPDVISYYLGCQKTMRFIPLPPLDKDPRDEQSREFQGAFANARLTDEIYLSALDEIDSSSDAALDQNYKLERELKDRVRELLNMPPHLVAGDISLPQHARNNGISPSYELPAPADDQEDERHTDTDIQTLLLPNDFERKMNALMTKCRTWMQETGINVLHAAFGFLEWTEPNGTESSFAPLILMPIKIDKKKTREGPKFQINSSGDKAEANMVLAEKMRLEFGIEMPKFNGGSIEDYLKEVTEVSPQALQWKVRRQVAFGVFPSARMAMYYDLDTDTNSFEENEAICHLFGGGGTSGAAPYADECEVDHPEIEQKVPYLVLDADSSQFSTLVDVANGKNIAVEGPPGTGKSQTIVNAIAAALADGKKVLFVAEKMAALDVVKSRLESVGLGEFILPLQADRSTRAQVVQSIRDRIEMDVGSASADYDAKIEVFRQTRSELATYIDVISAQVGQTGFTVFDILGKCMATNKVLEGKPEALLSPEIQNIDDFNNTRIDTFRELSGALEDSWRDAEDAEPYWQGHNVHHIDKFTVENICNAAKTAASAYGDAARARQELVAFNIGTRNNATELELIKTALETLRPIESTVDTVLVRHICGEQKLQSLTEFLDECTHYQAGQDEFAHLFTDTTDETLGDRLRSIESLCTEHEFETLDVEKLQSWRQEEAERLTKCKQTYDNLKSFIETLPESISYPVSVFKEARELVEATSREVLSLRDEITSDPAATNVISYAKKCGEELLESRCQLENVISVTQTVSIVELTTLAATISGAGPLSILSSTFRSAKRTYLALSRRDSFRKEVATKDIRLLIDWREAEKKFCSDQQVSTVFGPYFKGIDTEFSTFSHLINYYDTVERSFPGTANRKVRKFLKTGDLDLLQSLPEIDGYTGNGTFPDLAAEIENMETSLPNYDAAIEQLTFQISLLKKPDETSVAALTDLAKSFDKHIEHKTDLDCNEVRHFLNGRFCGASTKSTDFEDDVLAAKLIMELQCAPNVIINILENKTVDKSHSSIELVLSKDEEADAELLALSQLSKTDAAYFSADRTHAEVADYLSAASIDKDGLYVHSKYASTRYDFDDKGFGWVVKALLQDNFPLDDLANTIEAIIVRALASRVYHQFGRVLSQYPGTRLNELRRRLAKLDKEIIKMSRDQIRARVYQVANPPPSIGKGGKSTWTEMALVDHEVSKSRRHIPVRDLMRRAGKALLELKPCWMMSPLAVAQYLQKGELTFDLCIIDEASQMPPEDSVGALARSRQAMVVGDTNQLPPTSFFRKLVDDDNADEDETVLNESILEMANTAFRPKRRLRWHYRSRHSALIKFSSHMVYDDKLIIFPSASESRSDMGVSLTPVQGGYHSGTNGEEATAMVDAALEFMHTSPGRSLGLVTLNQRQRDLLLEKMEFALSLNTAASDYVDHWKEENDGLESFFIKNLENVQGDERDVIFIGTVYGPEQPGAPVMQRFGPINGLAGKRRLNVLFSRAKQQIVTFSSMTAADIRADEHGNAGAYMLKRWLEYSATGILHAGGEMHGEPDSDFERFVIDQIKAMGCEPVPQIGVKGYRIDIGVKHPDWPHGFIMAVECDGATYHSSKSARERDRLRQEVLEGLGWFFHRIWSTDWFNNPRKEAEILRKEILDRLADLKENSAAFIAPRTSAPLHEPEAESIIDETQRPIAEDRYQATNDEYAVITQEEFIDTIHSEDSDLNSVSVGDTVRIRYLSGENTVLEVVLSNELNSPNQGIVHINRPLGQALLGMEEGDEIEVLVGSYVRKAIIEKVIRGTTP